MGLFNKLLNKSDKSRKLIQEHKDSQKLKTKEKETRRKELTLAELKEQSEKRTVAGQKGMAKTIKATAKKTDTKEAYKHLLRPLVTEKGTYLNAQNKYIFEVSPRVNKVEIKKAVTAVYGVSPLKVNIIKKLGKEVRYGKVHGRTKRSKKAIVTLKEGDAIQVYEGV